MLNSILSALGFGWAKWQTIEENKPMIEESFNLAWGMVSRGRVFVDVQRRENALTGKIKYRNVKR
jgi:hypothetical protein